MDEAVPLYDGLSADYDVMVDWTERLGREGPFFEAAFARAGVSLPGTTQRVLDVGCGTGGHAIHFARSGREVVGADPSAPMLAQAKQRAEGLEQLIFVRAGFGELRAAVKGDFDAVTCLGNTLPHALDRALLYRALEDMAAVLRPGGILIIQQLNYDRICATRQRFLGITDRQLADGQLLFFRFYDFQDPLLTFHMVRFRQRPGEGWSFEEDATPLRPVLRAELAELLTIAGFGPREFFGSYERTPFAGESSGDLIVLATKRN